MTFGRKDRGLVPVNYAVPFAQKIQGEIERVASLSTTSGAADPIDFDTSTSLLAGYYARSVLSPSFHTMQVLQSGLYEWLGEVDFDTANSTGTRQLRLTLFNLAGSASQIVYIETVSAAEHNATSGLTRTGHVVVPPGGFYAALIGRQTSGGALNITYADFIITMVAR